MSRATRFISLVGAIAVTLVRPVHAEEAALPKGLSDGQVREVVQARKGDLLRCYRREQPRLGITSGRIDVRWEVRPSGKVEGARTMTDTIGSPDLQECIEVAVMRWTFPRFRSGREMVTMPFAFTPAGISFWRAAEAVSDVPDVEGGALRAFLLRFGPEFVTLGCVAGKRSFGGNICDAAIRRAPRIGTNPTYTIDSATMDVDPAFIRFEHERLDVRGFAITSWPSPPPDVLQDVGGLDGFGIWPPKAFTVELTPYGRERFHSSVVRRCKDDPWSPCRDADRPRDGGVDPGGVPYGARDDWPLAEGALALEARRLLAPLMRRFEAGWKLRLGETVSLDLDGDGKPEKLYNFAATEVQVPERPRRGKGRRVDWNPYAPTELFFIFAERGGSLVRLPVETYVSRLDGMDGAVLGWLDIDADGRPELWLDTPRYEGRTWQLVRLRDGAFRLVAEFGFNYWGVIEND